MIALHLGSITAVSDDHVEVIPLKPNAVPVLATLIHPAKRYVTPNINDLVLLLQDDDMTFYALPIDIIPTHTMGEATLTDPSGSVRVALKPGVFTVDTGRQLLSFNAIENLYALYAPRVKQLWSVGGLEITENEVKLHIAEQPDIDDANKVLTIQLDNTPTLQLKLKDELALTITKDKVYLHNHNVDLTIEENKITAQTSNDTLTWENGKWTLETQHLTVKANEIELGNNNLQPNNGVLTAATLPTCPFSGIPMTTVNSKTVKSTP